MEIDKVVVEMISFFIFSKVIGKGGTHSCTVVWLPLLFLGMAWSLITFGYIVKSRHMSTS